MPTLDVDGATLHYETRGSGWPLVLLHGAWVDHRLWRPQLDRFADRFHVVAPDLRGHGDSTTDEPFDAARMAADVDALVDELGLANPVVCGLSMGGLVAQDLALERPDDVAGLVLADSVRTIPPVPLTEGWRRLLFPAGPARLLARTWGVGPYFRSLLATIEGLQGPWLALDRATRQYALDCVDAYDPTAFGRVLDAFHAHRPSDLAAVSAPTLLVHGDHEAPPVVAQNREMAATIPDATRTVVPDAGHLANRDNPDAFGSALEGFLDDRVTVPA